MKKERNKHSQLLLSVSGKSPQTYVKIVVCFFIILVFSIKGFSQDIHRAVSEGDIEKVELLLKENPLLVNEEDSSGRTPIFTAIIRHNRKMVKLLIDKGALVRVGDSNLRAPIHFAGFMNDMSMMALLLEHGAVIDTRCHRCCNAADSFLPVKSIYIEPIYNQSRSRYQHPVQFIDHTALFCLSEQ